MTGDGGAGLKSLIGRPPPASGMNASSLMCVAKQRNVSACVCRIFYKTRGAELDIFMTVAQGQTKVINTKQSSVGAVMDDALSQFPATAAKRRFL